MPLRSTPILCSDTRTTPTAPAPDSQYVSNHNGRARLALDRFNFLTERDSAIDQERLMESHAAARHQSAVDLKGPAQSLSTIDRAELSFCIPNGHVGHGLEHVAEPDEPGRLAPPSF